MKVRRNFYHILLLKQHMRNTIRTICFSVNSENGVKRTRPITQNQLFTS